MAITFAVDTMADVEQVDTSGLDVMGDTMGNDILRDIARGEKVQRVTARGMVAGEVRGWTMGGRVD